MNYVIGTIVVLALAALALWGTGGMAFLILMPAMRLVPVVAAVLGAVAVAIIAARIGLGAMPAVVFGVAAIVGSLVHIMPFVPASGLGRVFGYVALAAPVLTLFPARVLWHIAKSMSPGR